MVVEITVAMGFIGALTEAFTQPTEYKANVKLWLSQQDELSTQGQTTASSLGLDRTLNSLT